MTRSFLAGPPPATHDNPTGLHCRRHALLEPASAGHEGGIRV